MRAITGDVLTIPQAAQILGRNRRTVRRWADKGEIAPGVRVIRLGGLDVVSRLQLEEFLRTGQAAS